MSAWSGASASPLGGGRRLTMASRMSGTPWPVFAETGIASVASEADGLLDHLLGAHDVGARQIDFG